MSILRLEIALVVLSCALAMSASATELLMDGQTSSADDSYFQWGVLFGSPTFLNLSIGWRHEPVELRLCGGYSAKDLNGIQIDFGCELIRTIDSIHSVGVAFGRTQDPGCDYSYFGPVYSFNRKRFFCEFGVCRTFNVNRGDFSDLLYWIIFQVGYMRRFG